MNNLYHPDSIFNDFSLKEMQEILLSIPRKLAHKNEGRLKLNQAINSRDKYELMEFENENAEILFSFLIGTLNQRTSMGLELGGRGGERARALFSSSLTSKKFNEENNKKFIETVCIQGLYSDLPEVKKHFEGMSEDIARFNAPTGNSEIDWKNGFIFDQLVEDHNEMLFNMWNGLIDVSLALKVIHELRIHQRINKDVDEDLVSEILAYNEEVTQQYAQIGVGDFGHQEYMHNEKINRYKKSVVTDNIITIRGEDVIQRKEDILRKQADDRYDMRISNIYVDNEFKTLTLSLFNGDKKENSVTEMQIELLRLLLDDPAIQFSKFSNYELVELRGGDINSSLKWIENTVRGLNIKVKEQSGLDEFIHYNTNYTQINNNNITEDYLRNS